jgi:hypothetical protein
MSQIKEKKIIKLCKHGKNKYLCVACGGSSVCKHNRQRCRCVDCNGASICQHKKQKHRCKICKGSSICDHNKMRHQCGICGGSSVCEHNRLRRSCKDCNFTGYLIQMQRNNLNRVLKSSNLEKTMPSIEYLGCNAVYFRDFIQSKMTEEMTWDNIHLDHIKPVAAFNLNNHDEFLDCCHYTNFQPLLAETNINKSDKWSEANEAFWQENIKGKKYLLLYIDF